MPVPDRPAAHRPRDDPAGPSDLCAAARSVDCQAHALWSFAPCVHARRSLCGAPHAQPRTRLRPASAVAARFAAQSVVCRSWCIAVQVRKQGGKVQALINVNAKAQFEQNYWRGVLDSQGKVDGGYY